MWTVLKSKGSLKLKQKHKYRSTGAQCKPMTSDFSAMFDTKNTCENTVYANKSILDATFSIKNEEEIEYDIDSSFHMRRNFFQAKKILP